MGRLICKIPHEGKDYYLIWSTVVDSFVTYGLPLDEFTEWMREEEGRRYMEFDHANRMERVEAKGTSSRMDNSVEEVVTCNRCGPGETRISMEGIIYQFITRRGQKVTEDEMLPYLNPYTSKEVGEEDWEEHYKEEWEAVQEKKQLAGL